MGSFWPEPLSLGKTECFLDDSGRDDSAAIPWEGVVKRTPFSLQMLSSLRVFGPSAFTRTIQGVLDVDSSHLDV